MKSLSRLWNAVSTLAGALEGLAALVNSTSDKLRHSLALEGVEPAQLTGPDEDSTPRRKVKAAS